MRGRRLSLLLLSFALACGDDDGTSDGGSAFPDGSAPDGFALDGSDASFVDAGPADAGPAPMALLYVHSLDLWGQPFPRGEGSLTVYSGGDLVARSSEAELQVALYEAGTYTLVLEAPGHHTMEATVTYDGGGADDALGATTPRSETPGGLLVAHGEEQVGAWPVLPTHRVLLGLRHRYFSAQGPPARRGNDVTLYTSCDTAWAAVDAEIRGATESVHMASWWWESDFELVRDAETHPFLSDAERAEATIISALESNSATSRIMIGQLVSQDGLLSNLSTDEPLRSRGAASGDNFEYMGQANETSGRFEFMVEPMAFSDRVFEQGESNGVPLADYRLDGETLLASVVPPHPVDLNDWPLGISLEIQAASWHQKFSVMDGEVAFVGGMNLQAVDWDTEEHLVFEPRRMEFDTSLGRRMDVITRERQTDTPPRKDFFTRIEGPVVEDVNAIFEQRWSYLIDTDVEYADEASPFTAQPVAPAGDIQAQVTVTMPEPFWDHSIAESWFNAVNQAENFIFVEDQYWRVPMLVDAIVERMEEVPELQLVVITRPMNQLVDPGCEWTYITNEQIESRFPDRYTLLQIRAFDYTDDDFGPDETRGHFPEIYIHSKMLIVDDVFMSVGSANKNNRGIVYEGEMNLAVYDAAWVAAEREGIVEHLLPAGMSVMAGTAWIEQLREAASWNDFVYENWDDEAFDINLNGDPLPDDYRPRGFLYSMSFPDSDSCFIEGVGPDMM
ncbi:MAG: phosphatidylserine/phosphatidylglycerophosphate/cardiolipin synthase family protein [Polyangiales bacterium]